MNYTSISSRSIVVVHNVDPTKVKRDALMKVAHVIHQNNSLSVYKYWVGITDSHRTFLSRQPGDSDPITASKLAEILETNPAGQGVIIEDFTRLINGEKTGSIGKQCEFLGRNLPKMFSIRQHNTIVGLGAVGLFRLACIEVAQRSDRTARAKKAAANKDPDESKAASKKANAVKTILAQRKALKLRQHIDRIRDSLTEIDRSNHAAIARQLNEASVPTPSGSGKWQTTTVSRVLKAAAEYDREREELRQKMEARKLKRLQTTNRTPSGM